MFGCGSIRFRRVISLLVCALCPFGCSTGGNLIKIGFFGPLTGNTATAGQSLRNGARIAIEEVNAAGGLLGRKLVLVEYDDRSSPEQAARAATKLVTADRVVAVVGSLHSGNILAAAPILEEFQTPTLGSGTSPKWLQQGYRYFFRSLASSRISVRELARYAARAGLHRVAIMHSNDEYGTNGANDFSASAREWKIEIIGRESFTHGDRDFTGQFARILLEKPDAVLIWALGDDLGALTKQLRQSGFSGPILGAEGYTMPQALEIAGKAADGVILAAQYFIPGSPEEAEDPLTRRFLRLYLDAFHQMPASDNAYRGYDAMKIIAEGIRRANSLDRIRIRDEIQAIRDFRGIAGNFTFAGYEGEGIHEMRIYRIQGGRLVGITGN